MERLWAPWRLAYIQQDKGTQDGCVFCVPESTDEDRQRLILHRGKHAFVVMNRFPYNNGHLLVTPYRHTADPGVLSDAETLEMQHLLVLCRDVLQECMAPNGFNIGLNLGQAAGAGIADHLHLHIVPRWNGDTNFMPVFSEVRVIPQHLEAGFECLNASFARRRL